MLESCPFKNCWICCENGTTEKDLSAISLTFDFGINIIIIFPLWKIERCYTLVAYVHALMYVNFNCLKNEVSSPIHCPEFFLAVEFYFEE